MKRKDLKAGQRFDVIFGHIKPPAGKASFISLKLACMDIYGCPLKLGKKLKEASYLWLFSSSVSSLNLSRITLQQTLEHA
jgi:hypothetical protein